VTVDDSREQPIGSRADVARHFRTRRRGPETPAQHRVWRHDEFRVRFGLEQAAAVATAAWSGNGQRAAASVARRRLRANETFTSELQQSPTHSVAVRGRRATKRTLRRLWRRANDASVWAILAIDL
jgi:hypothetical protein